MNTYIFTYINKNGNGEIVASKEYEKDEQAKDFGLEIINNGIREEIGDEINRFKNTNRWEPLRVIIDKYEAGYDYKTAEDPDEGLMETFGFVFDYETEKIETE